MRGTTGFVLKPPDRSSSLRRLGFDSYTFIEAMRVLGKYAPGCLSCCFSPNALFLDRM